MRFKRRIAPCVSSLAFAWLLACLTHPALAAKPVDLVLDVPAAITLHYKISQETAGAHSIADAVDRIAAQEDTFFSERFIQPRPLLQAISSEQPVALLRRGRQVRPGIRGLSAGGPERFPGVDPRARHPQGPPHPLRVSDLQRLAGHERCAQATLPAPLHRLPQLDLELKIVKLKFPNLGDRLAAQLVDAIRRIRTMDLKKKPAISETLDWAQALLALQVEDLSLDVLRETLNVICKHRSDVQQVGEKIGKVMG